MLIWSKSYSVGNPKLDDQHRGIFESINKIAALSNCDFYDLEEATALLNDLMDYAQIHFSLEESLMKEAGYPELEKHIQAHSAYYSETTEMLLEAIHGGAPLEKMYQFLRSWWSEHIMVEDRGYIPYIALQ